MTRDSHLKRSPLPFFGKALKEAEEMEMKMKLDAFIEVERVRSAFKKSWGDVYFSQFSYVDLRNEGSGINMSHAKGWVPIRIYLTLQADRSIQNDFSFHMGGVCLTSPNRPDWISVQDWLAISEEIRWTLSESNELPTYSFSESIYQIPKTTPWIKGSLLPVWAFQPTIEMIEEAIIEVGERLSQAK